ncbi:Plant specific mitochondrial import receptor subunit TOM20 [Artemisia annua]|uniref:Plant specific mitochondrial import receptor subunit TOM20 n=1 Tax=Artemisia annua TaxID=35608 RepID=A0A2U1N1T1_ARTAN|nr:Plant specific mitochondrial import receptor subunit TOM20 [Artemisia annua]
MSKSKNTRTGLQIGLAENVILKSVGSFVSFPAIAYRLDKKATISRATNVLIYHRIGRLCPEPPGQQTIWCGANRLRVTLKPGLRIKSPLIQYYDALDVLDSTRNDVVQATRLMHKFISCAFPRLLRAEVEEQPIKPYFPQRPCMGDAETSDAFVTPDEDKAKGYVDSTYVYFQPVPEEDSGNDLYFFGFVDVWFPDALQLLKADLQLRQGKVSNLQPCKPSIDENDDAEGPNNQMQTIRPNAPLKRVPKKRPAAMQQHRHMLQKYHHTKVDFEVKVTGNRRAFCWPMCTRKHCSSMLLPTDPS